MSRASEWCGASISHLAECPAPPIVHVVDDDASFRAAVARLLDASGYQVALYGSAVELLERLPSGESGCILLDVKMSGLSGPQLQERLGEIGHKLPIVFLTGYGDVPTSVRAIKAGAEDFLTKPVPKKDLLAAIERALNRYDEIRDHDRRIAAMQSLVSSLTPREREVFTRVVHGKPNKQIAHELGTVERTIKAHRHQVMEKCKVQSLVELVLIAERLSMLPSPAGNGLRTLE
jgi:FixJ family two-component response regulator